MGHFVIFLNFLKRQQVTLYHEFRMNECATIMYLNLFHIIMDAFMIKKSSIVIFIEELKKKYTDIILHLCDYKY